MTDIKPDGTLSAYLAPKTLTECGITGTHMTASVWYASTTFKKGGIHRLLKKLPIIKNLTPIKDDVLKMDLDLSCVVLDHQKQVLSVIWYGNLQNDDNSIWHEGDALGGAVDFEDALHPQEQIHVALGKLSKSVHELLFYLTSHHKHDLSLAQKGTLKLADNEQTTLYKHTLQDLPKGTHGVLLWHFIKQGEDFLVKAPLMPITITSTDPKALKETLTQSARQS